MFEVALRASGPLRPPSDEQEGASRSRQALGLEGRTGMVYWGDAKHEQASSLSHERGWPPPRRAKRKENFDSDEAPQWTLIRAKRDERLDGSSL